MIGQVLLDVAPPEPARGRMSLTESRLTRTVAPPPASAPAPDGRTHVDDDAR